MTWIFGWSVCLLLFDESVSLNQESSLVSKLLRNGYNPTVRPRARVGDAVHVHIGLDLNCVSELNEVNQVLHTVGYLASEWNDDFLQWNPEDFGDVEHLVLPPSMVWLPDFAISNSADTFYHDTFTRDFRVDVKYTGRVLWEFGGNFATSCTLDMTYYPFDSQSCKIVVDNWAYTKDAVDLINSSAEITTTDISANGEWDLVRTESSASTFEEDTHHGKLFPRVIFTLHMHRKPLYYFINIITPCLFCIIISIMVFWLPPESGEKVSLGITVLLSFSVFQLVVAENTPKTSDSTPLLSVLMSAIMGLTTISVLSTILVLHQFHHSTAKRAPGWLRTLAFQGLARLLCMRSYVPVDGTSATLDQPVSPPSPALDKRDSLALDSLAESSELAEIRALLRHIVDSMKGKVKNWSVGEEWKGLAMVLDRLFFWIIAITAGIMIPMFLVQRDKSLY